MPEITTAAQQEAALRWPTSDPNLAAPDLARRFALQGAFVDAARWAVERTASAPAPALTDLAAAICEGDTAHVRDWPVNHQRRYCGQCLEAAERVRALADNVSHGRPPFWDPALAARLIDRDRAGSVR